VTRLLLPALLILVAIVIRTRLRWAVPLEPDEHEAGVPMTWSLDPSNAITIRYLVGPVGVRNSMN
jgi:hypothetical protein